MSEEPKTTRWFWVTVWDIDYDFAACIKKGHFKWIRRGGLEYAPDTGKEHYHCIFYAKHDKPKTNSGFNAISNLINAKIHCWVKDMKGSIEQCTVYGTKDNPSEDFGTMPKQGRRTDLEVYKEDILNGEVSVDELCLEKPMLFHQYGRTLNKIEDIALRRKFRNWMTTCEWIYGKTGVGKSHKAFENFNPDTHYVYPNDNGWWDGYTGQETVIINEFRGGIAYSELLELIDRWPKTVKRRNREPVPFLAKHIIITSSMPPNEVYCNLSANDKLEQLTRRITVTLLQRAEVV